MRREYSKTWMLFESGSGVAVDLSLHRAAGDQSRPIDAYVVTEYEGEFTRAARRAAEAVYHAALASGEAACAMVVGYDLQGLPAGCPVTGESGGLAFAVALGKRLLKQDPGPVAATGEVRSGHDGGPIGAVLGITEKLAAAGRLLPAGGWVLYPRDNDGDIPDDLKASLEQNGLKLHPVSRVSEALALVFDLPGTDATPTDVPRADDWDQPAAFVIPRHRLWWLGGVLLVLMGMVATYLLWPAATPRVTDRVSPDPVASGPATPAGQDASMPEKDSVSRGRAQEMPASGRGFD